MTLNEKADEKFAGFSAVQDEHVERRLSTAEEVTELSGIEATAASSAAWLISITVSIGGFLFGMFSAESSGPGDMLTV